MYSAGSNLMIAQEAVSQARNGYEAPELRTAQQIYNRTRRKARLGRLWSALAGRPNGLLRLDNAPAAPGRSAGGLRTIPVDQIRGSEGRANDFDADFRPLRDTTRSRWVNIARAHLAGRPLPLIQVVQIGDAYYVRDGHHRVSVARALGQAAIEAEVI